MKLTKSDLMHLPKERLAELIVEMQGEQNLTFTTPEEVEEDFKRTFWWDLDRPHIVFEHDKPLFQKYSTCTQDGGKTFHFAGEII